MGGLYGIMAVISVLVRQFVLPNPFECFGDRAIIINWIAEPILHGIAYSLVGLFYNKGEFPALGSFLYLVVYAAITGVLVIMGIFSFAWWWIIAVIVIVITVSVSLRNFGRRRWQHE